MFNHTPQEYIGLFNALSQSSTSHQANQKLMQILNMEQSWQIAKQLIISGNPSYQAHGCQLLSKKLDRPYTIQMQQKLQVFQFILGLPQLTNMLCYIIAKICLHLGFETIQLKAHTSPINLINVLKSLPSASRVITLPPSLNPKSSTYDERNRAIKLFNRYKPHLVQAFGQYGPQVVDCLESFTSQNFKIQSEQLVRLLLTQPLEQVSEILQNILLGQKYENLHNEIYQYLQTQFQSSSLAQYNVVYIAFVRSVNLLEVNAELLKQIFSRILAILKKQNTLGLDQRKNCCYISDSFELWADLQIKMSQLQIKNSNDSIKNIDQLNICKQAFFQLWKIVVERCLEYQMPKFRQITQDVLALVINIDDDQDEQAIQKPADDRSNKFRNTGQDFLNTIIIAYTKSIPYKNKCLQCLKDLVISNNPLYLQLAIFVISCVIQNVGENSMLTISGLIQSIVNNQNTKDPYIWQQLIKLLGRLGHEAVCNGVIFQTALIVIRESILIDQLAVLACETFNQILVTCNNSSQKESQTPLLQKLFQFIYSNIYFNTSQKAIFERLTKSSILFIYYFKPNLQYFQNYLQSVNAKIEQMKNLGDRSEIIENIAMSHNFILPDNSKQFTPILSQFFLAYFPVFIKQIETSPSKKLGYIFNQLSSTVWIGGGYNTSLWVQGLLQLSKIPNISSEKSLLISLFNKIMTVEQYDEHYKPEIINLITNAQQFVTNSIVQASDKEFKTINKGLTFHLNILNNYITNFANYSPDRLINFIVQKIFKGYLRYQAESVKTSLAILRHIIQKKYKVQLVFEQVLKILPKNVVSTFWNSFEPLLVQAYKVGGTQLYESCFYNVFPNVAPPNPLFDVIIQSIVGNNMKNIKNLLSSLK